GLADIEDLRLCGARRAFRRGRRCLVGVFPGVVAHNVAPNARRAIINPRNRAATARTTDSPTYAPAMPYSRRSTINAVSSEKAETVVNPPSRPTAAKTRTLSDPAPPFSASQPANSPMTRPPTTLTLSVPHGQVEPGMRRAAAT